MKDKILNFGFNIITECKEIKNKDKSCKSGELVQYGKPYTDDADILQSILKYKDCDIQDYFLSRDLSKEHLIKKCNYYINLYDGGFEVKDKTNPGALAERMNPRVVSLLYKLVNLKLITFEFYETENHQISEKYWFTKLGKLIGILLLYKNDNNVLLKDILSSIIDFYNGMNHSYAKLCSIFFNKCYNTPIFKRHVDLLFNLLENADNKKDLFLDQNRKVYS